MPSASSSSHSSTSEFLKVPGFPGLYRNSKSGIYLGVKKVQGKRKERSLKTTDRKIAERRFKAWIEDLGRVDKEVEKTTLEDLFARLLAVSAGKSPNSIDIIEGIRDEFLGWWPYGSKFQVRNVRPSHLEEWLALLGNRVRNSSYRILSSHQLGEHAFSFLKAWSIHGSSHHRSCPGLDALALPPLHLRPPQPPLLRHGARRIASYRCAER